MHVLTCPTRLTAGPPATSPLQLCPSATPGFLTVKQAATTLRDVLRQAPLALGWEGGWVQLLVSWRLLQQRVIRLVAVDSTEPLSELTIMQPAFDMVVSRDGGA